MTDRPLMTWEELTVGDDLREFSYEVTPEVALKYREAIDDWTLQTVDGVAVAPPALVTFPVLNSIDNTWTQRPGMVHAIQSFEFHAPIRVGATLTVTGKLTSMQLKRGRRFLTIDTDVSDDSGTVASASTTLLYPNDKIGG